MWSRSWSRASVLGAVAALAGGCGGGGDSQPSPSPLAVAKAPAESGDLQTGAVGQALTDPLRIIVTRDGVPEAGATVTWSTSDGSLNPVSGTTDADGFGSSTWTLGPDAGTQTAQAAVAGATGSPLTFSATATGGGPPPPPPPGTVAVAVGNIFFRSNRNNTSNPAVDTVAVNGTVTWTWVNTGPEPHSVQSTGGTSFTSSDIQSGSGVEYQFQFPAAGTYTYNCAVHGSSMTGRVVVR